MSNGDDIAAEIRAGLIEAGEATGNGPYYAVFRSDDPAGTSAVDPEAAETTAILDPRYNELVIVEETTTRKDMDGTLTGYVTRKLLVEAGAVAPTKSDTVALGIRTADVDANTTFEEIKEVKRVAFGGRALMYEVYLKD